MNMLVKDISFKYEIKDILKEVSFSVKKGEVVSIIGPNGSGKSTLIKCLNGIFKAKSGCVYINDKNIKEIKNKELAKIIAYVPQVSSEVFIQRVFDTVLMGRKPHLKWGIRELDLEIVEGILDYMGLKDIEECYLDELSGGQKQKVLIARALAQEPKILLLDEPTSSLDINHQLEVLNTIKSISKRGKCSVIMVIHDLNLAYRFSDKIVLIKDGKVFNSGKPREILTVKNIKKVYGADVSIINTNLGSYIVPIIGIENESEEIKNKKIMEII